MCTEVYVKFELTYAAVILIFAFKRAWDGLITTSIYRYCDGDGMKVYIHVYIQHDRKKKNVAEQFSVIETTR
jgi:hypothetical protein